MPMTMLVIPTICLDISLEHPDVAILHTTSVFVTQQKVTREACRHPKTQMQTYLWCTDRSLQIPAHACGLFLPPCMRLWACTLLTHPVLLPVQVEMVQHRKPENKERSAMTRASDSGKIPVERD
eukprot:354196-Chlamydomonas_euryale.AAC.14